LKGYKTKFLGLVQSVAGRRKKEKKLATCFDIAGSKSDEFHTGLSLEYFIALLPKSSRTATSKIVQENGFPHFSSSQPILLP